MEFSKTIGNIKPKLIVKFEYPADIVGKLKDAGLIFMI
jgi:hypothetical protein